jgi:RNA polymerase sigma-70 factor (ECF subfamily)
MSLLEEEVLQRAVSGDRDALTALLEHHAPALRHRLEGKIDPRWQAVLSVDDVMQETFTDVFLGVSRFAPQGEGAFLRWLFTLARNNLRGAIKELKSLKKGGDRQRLGGNPGGDSCLDLLHLLGGATTSPSTAAARNEAQQLLNRALERLPSPDAAVVRLYDLEDRPIDEVAEVLGCSRGAAFMRRARAHARLRQLLGRSSLGSFP